MEQTAIYIVEDDRFVAQGLQRNLTRLNYRIAGTAKSGEEALNQINALRPDIVIMDITLQGELDGIQTAKLVWQRFKIPVIFLTGHLEESIIQKAKLSQPYAFLLKPIAPKELHSTIQISLERHKSQSYELDRTSKELEQTQQLYQLIFENSGTAMAITDQEFNIQLTNQEFATLIQEGETTSQHKHNLKNYINFTKLVSKQSLATIQNIPNRSQCDFTPPNQDVKHMIMLCQPLADEKQLLFSFIDNTKNIQAEQQLRESQLQMSYQRDLALKLSHYSDLNQAMELCIDFALETTIMCCGTIFLLSEDSSCLNLISQKGHPISKQAQLSIETQESIKLLLYLSEQLPYFGHIEPQMLPLFTSFNTDLSSRTCSILPLHYEGLIVGFICLLAPNSQAIPLKDRNTLENITAQMGGAISRLNAVDALRKSEEQYRLLAENTRDIIWTMNLDGKPTYISPSLQRLLGISHTDYADIRIDEILTPASLAYAKKVFTSLQQTIHNDLSELVESQILELECYTKDGNTIWTESIISMIYDEHANPMTILGVTRDITAKRNALLAKQMAEGELEKQRTLAISSDRLRSLGEMAAAIAHELNQPLSGVRGLAEHILIGQLRGWDLNPEKLREKVSLIIEQADRMSHIIEHVRMFSREADKPDMKLIDITEVIDSTLGLVGAQLKARGIAVRIHHNTSHTKIMANPFSLEEVFVNLLQNARDAIEESPETDNENKNITISTFHTVDNDKIWVHVSVEDYGIGISEEAAQKAFDPFFTTKGPDKGTGLGLAICKSIVESFSGSIFLESQLKQGTIITLRFPVEGEHDK